MAAARKTTSQSNDAADLPEEAPPPRPKKGVLAAAIALVLLTGWEIGAMVIQHRSAPTAADWKAAATKVREERVADKEPLLFAPLWVEPLGRLHLGDQLSLEQMLLSDVDRHAVVWSVGIRGARHPWLVGRKPSAGWSFGAVTVERFENDRPATVLFDFTQRIMEAQVDRIGGQVIRCARAGRQFRCDQRMGWNWVGPHLAEVNHRPYRCIYAHPVDGHVMRISFPAVRMGSALVGYTGIDDFENRKRADTPVGLKVFAGPELLGTVRHQNHWPWRRFTLDTTRLAGQTHSVRFEVAAEGAYARSFCFAAEARK